MRIHLGHHFYGAGNLGDDFMLAGFLAGMRSLAPQAAFSCSVPFALEPLRARFPEVAWLPYDVAAREQAIGACDVWLGLGGSPFQSAQSRWFVDHLLAEAQLCARHGRPMFFLGIGVQTATELARPEIADLCARAAGIWTRDPASAARIRGLPSPPPIVAAAADLAHAWFQDNPPPPASRGRVSAVLNFDYGAWPGQAAALAALAKVEASERVWLAQESRELPGAERALFAALPPAEQARWKLVSPDAAAGSTAPLGSAMAHWPSGEWLLTSRFHAAIAGAWAGSRIVTISTNEKLRGIAHDLHVPAIAPDADEAAVSCAFAAAAPVPRALLAQMAESAHQACAEFLDASAAHRR